MQSLKKLFSFRGLFALVLVAISIHLISPETVFAVGDSEKSVLGSLAELLGVLISVLTFVSLLMMKFFGQLLGTDLLTGPEAMQALTPMWVWVRNLTNILFVIVLVGLAFSNLFASFSGENGGNWTIKEKLPKVIIALVAINFSLLGFKVVIDAVNVGTVAILGIADSRLDIDNPDQKSAMINSKTWTVVTENTYDKFNGRIIEPDDKEAVKAGGSCTTEYNNEFSGGNSDKKVLGISKLVSEKTVYYICRDFRSQVNDLFCSGWDSERKDYDKEGTTSEDLNDDCLFILKKDTFKTMLDPDDEPGQNLFMSFGTTFMHLEKLPALGAKIDSLNGLIMNTLFSSILSIAYIVALVAIFIALLVRVIVIWIALVFSPILIAASIMGFGDGKAGEASEKIITYLIMPLKIAAAFAVSFVMMSGMVEFNVVQQGDGFLFGPALSNLGIDGYGFMWQMATIAIFWTAAKWASDGEYSKFITDKIFTGAEALGETAARAATIDRQIFSVGTGDTDKKFSLSSVMRMPEAVKEMQRADQQKSFRNMQSALGFTRDKALEKLQDTEKFSSADDLMKAWFAFQSRNDASKHWDDFVAAAKRSKDHIREGDVFIKKLEEGQTKFEQYIKNNGGKHDINETRRDMVLGTYGSAASGTGADPKKPEDDPAKKNDEVSVDSKGYHFKNKNDKQETASATEVIDVKGVDIEGVRFSEKDVAQLVSDTGKTFSEVLTALKHKKAVIAGADDINTSTINYNSSLKTTMFNGKMKNGIPFVQLFDDTTKASFKLSNFGGTSENKITEENIANIYVETKKAADDGNKEAEKLLNILEKEKQAIIGAITKSKTTTDITAEIKKALEVENPSTNNQDTDSNSNQ